MTLAQNHDLDCTHYEGLFFSSFFTKIHIFAQNCQNYQKMMKIHHFYQYFMFLKHASFMPNIAFWIHVFHGFQDSQNHQF